MSSAAPSHPPSASMEQGSPSSSRGGAGDLEADDDDPAFVIKNLDTGLEMNIDDFDRLAHIAADEAEQPGQAPSQKKAGLMKGTKALKHWTQAQARKAQAATKKAVSHVKEVAREAAHEVQAVQQVLQKHKLGFEPSPRSAQHGGTELSPLPVFGDLLRRSAAGETSPPGSAASHAGDNRQSGSLASVSVPASSAPSGTSQGSGPGKQQQQQLLLHPDPAAAGAAAGLGGGAALVQHQQQHGQLQLSGPLTSRAAEWPAAAGTSGAAAAGGPGGAVSPSVVVPALVRLVSHKSSRRPYEAAVLAQVLEGGAGVVWAVAASADGSFLAAAGQDGVVRVWQLTASSSKHTRSNWVYSSQEADQQAAAGADAWCSTPLGGRSSTDGDCSIEQPHPAAAGGSFSELSQRPPLQQQQQQQQHDSSSAQPVLPPDHPEEGQQQQQWHGLQQQAGASSSWQQSPRSSSSGPLPSASPQQPLPWQQQQQSPQQPVLPPVVEFGQYFSRAPVRAYAGHTEDVLCLSWSCSGGFLLSGSLDKAVRLWHLSQPGCLREFPHSDFVTAVQFHPGDAQRFVSGSLDGKIRVWSIMDGSVLAAVALHQDMVTSVAFSLSGARVMAGTMRGRVRFYDLTADGKLEYVAQVDVRNQRGQHASGKKVTGIAAVPGAPQQFLITTNDSRLRLLEGYGQALKFKGHKNSVSQVRAALSPDGAQVACGSDDGCVFLWNAALGGGSGGSGGSLGGKGGGGVTGTTTGGGGSGGGTERARAMAAAAAAQYQQLVGKNASYQAFQSLEPGLPVTAVAFVPPGAAGLPRASVLCSQSTPGAALQGSTGSGAGAGVDASVAPGGGGLLVDGQRVVVQQLLVSAGFSGGAVRVHELLGGAPVRSS